MFPSNSFLHRKRSISGSDSRRRSLSDSDLSSQLGRKNQDLARENAMLREKCRLLENKMQKLEKIDIDMYPEKVEALVTSVGPIVDELEIFKRKLSEFQEKIRSGLDDAMRVKSATRTSVAAFCRLSEAEREHHRQAAGNRLREIGNNWDLSRISEASNASRARISTMSLTGHMGRISLSNVHESDSPVFDENCEDDAVNLTLIQPSHPPGTSGSSSELITATTSVSSAAGDQVLASGASDANQCLKLDGINLSSVSPVDELTDIPEKTGAGIPKQKAMRGKAVSTRAPRQPRLKKPDPVSYSDSGDTENACGSDVVLKPVPLAESSDEARLGQNLRPRRKGVNYRDTDEAASPPATKKKPVRRIRKTPAAE